LGEKEGSIVVIWESLSKQGKENWLEDGSTMHDWVVWCKSKKGAEEIRSFELSGGGKSALTTTRIPQDVWQAFFAGVLERPSPRCLPTLKVARFAPAR